MDARTLFPVLIAALLAGCATPEPIVIREPVEVKVPVPVRIEPPAELVAPYVPADIPEFVSPGDPEAAAALTSEGLARLRAIMRALMVRDAAWRAWSSAPVD